MASPFLMSLDLSSAFYAIDHSILLSTSSQSCFGLSGTATKWLPSYLSGRAQIRQTWQIIICFSPLQICGSQGPLWGPWFSLSPIQCWAVSKMHVCKILFEILVSILHFLYLKYISARIFSTVVKIHLKYLKYMYFKYFQRLLGKSVCDICICETDEYHPGHTGEVGQHYRKHSDRSSKKSTH